jgi:hypothetical protein
MDGVPAARPARIGAARTLRLPEADHAETLFSLTVRTCASSVDGCASPVTVAVVSSDCARVVVIQLAPALVEYLML